MTTLSIQTNASIQEIETLKTFLYSIDPQAIIQETFLSAEDTLRLYEIYTQYKNHTLTLHSDSQTQDIMTQKGIKW
ncbi:hypothetical protein [Helicobacter equorum]|uniref:Uncharacterized protein n=1 Tax=Helicobacter equorum TaxID=361872 RepID=A0A3D8IQ67_9HELI|nr:hypothetical protein [Helicobacter equorum]RDU67427.1 hypothetical protein CQA54_05520 [Helicobacter equorum]